MSSAPPSARKAVASPTQNGTVAFVTQLPECTVCKHIGTTSQKESPAIAEYDFRMQMGSWAYGCRDHYERFRMHPELGIGKGQKLQVRE